LFKQEDAAGYNDDLLIALGKAKEIIKKLASDQNVSLPCPSFISIDLSTLKQSTLNSV